MSFRARSLVWQARGRSEEKTDLTLAGLYTTSMEQKPGAFEQAAREVEAEVKHVLEFVETRVVPKARRDGEKVLRRISEELNRWADHLHDQSPPGEDKK